MFFSVFVDFLVVNHEVKFLKDHVHDGGGHVDRVLGVLHSLLVLRISDLLQNLRVNGCFAEHLPIRTDSKGMKVVYSGSLTKVGVFHFISTDSNEL